MLNLDRYDGGRPGVTPQALAPAAQTGSELALPTGAIAGRLRPLGVDRRRRMGRYELLVANETPATLHAIAYAAAGARKGGVAWSSVSVPAGASVSVPVELPIPRRNPPRKVVAELYAGGAHLRIDADALRLPPPPIRRAGALLGCLVACASLAGAYAFARPGVAALAVPATATAGEPVRLAYAFSGATERAEYRLRTAGGRVVRRGTLDPHGGSLALVFPTRGHYQLEVSGGSLLGAASGSASITALAPQNGRRLTPQIALAAGTVGGGEAIEVRYPSALGAGVVKLLDQDGTERAEALLSARGSSLLIAPNVERTQDFRVVVDAHRGNGVQEMQLPVRVEHVAAIPPVGKLPPAAYPVAGAETGPAGAASSAAMPAASGSGSEPIAVAPAVRAGKHIAVTVLRSLPNMRVALVDDSGNEIQSAAVAPLERRLDLAAPAVAERTQYLVVATYSRGSAQESVIKPVTVRP